MERNIEKCFFQNIIFERFLSLSAFRASLPLSFSLSPGSLYMPPFLYGEFLLNRPPARDESSGESMQGCGAVVGLGCQEQKEPPTGSGWVCSEKAACPENTSASWIAKIRGSKMRHKSETFRGNARVWKSEWGVYFQCNGLYPAFLREKVRKLEAVLCFWMLIYSADSSAQSLIFCICPNY